MMILDYCKMARFRQIVFLITILAFIGIFLLSRAGRKQPLLQTSPFELDNIYDDSDLTEEERKHKKILQEGRLNIPELGLNFIESMEHNKKV